MTNGFGQPLQIQQPTQNGFVNNVAHLQVVNHQESKNKLLSAFITQFINQSFIEDIVNIVMYDANVGASALIDNTLDSTKSIKQFLTDCNKDIELLKNINTGFPINVVRNSIRFAKQVVNLRNETGNRLISYDNLEEHFSSIVDLHIKKMIQNVRTGRITNINEFRTKFDIVMQTIQLSNELRLLRDNLLSFDALIEASQNGTMPLLNLATEYRNVLIDAYGKLSELRVVSKANELSDYMIISNDDSIRQIAENITTYLSDSYSFFKSGYRLIDESLGGIESANVHIICGPSNNAKSLFLVNLAWQMILNNINDFQEGDMFVFFTLEDEIYRSSLNPVNSGKPKEEINFYGNPELFSMKD